LGNEIQRLQKVDGIFSYRLAFRVVLLSVFLPHLLRLDTTEQNINNAHHFIILVATVQIITNLPFSFQFGDKVLGGKNPLSYVLLIVCFVLAWVETWMLDFKVIPSENRWVKTHRGDDVVSTHIVIQLYFVSKCQV